MMLIKIKKDRKDEKIQGLFYYYYFFVLFHTKDD